LLLAVVVKEIHVAFTLNQPNWQRLTLAVIYVSVMWNCVLPG
jgi:hypothetical protein